MTVPKRRGRLPKADKPSPVSGTGLGPQLAADLRDIQKEIEARTMFPVTIADVVRHLIGVYRNQKSKP